MAFTEEQLRGINEENKNIIVSAGAGSGKTAVLTARVIRKLKDGIDINKILILTFTNEAAAEMKSRIRASIYENKLNRQLALLDSSYITTFDSFALSIVKKYHYILNINPNVSIIDSNIIEIKKKEILTNIFEKLYQEKEPLFIKLINDFCLKDDDNIKEYILKISNSQDLLLNKDDYLNTYIDKYYKEENICFYIEKYIEIISEKINEIKKIYENFKYYIKDSLKEKLDEYYNSIFYGNTYDDYKLIKGKPTVRFVGVDESGKSIKEELVNETKELISLLSYESIEEIKESILKTKDYAIIIIRIIKELNEEIIKYKQIHDTYEFNDIAHYAINIVLNNKEIQDELKNYFNEIMIDEYQDTSIIQETFINLISNNNVYMVGDIKQSIYRFRNANPYIFKDKYTRYSNNDNGIKIDLLKNFRSRKETLYNINEIFNLIMDNEIGDANYKEEHNMINGNTDYDTYSNNQLNYLEIYNYKEEEGYKDYEQELFIVAEDINKKIKEKYLVYDKSIKSDNKLRPVKFSDICIITDRNKYLDTYKKILEYSNIPSIIYKQVELTADNDILVIKNLIKLVILSKKKTYNQEFKYAYTSVARSYLFSYKDDLIYQTLENNNFEDDLILSLCNKIDLNHPINEVISNILFTFNVYEKLTTLNNINESIIRINNLCKIASSLNELCYSIEDFINYFEEIINNDMQIKFNIKAGGENAVKIMNIHKSKGLEFPICYFVGMKNQFQISEIKEKMLFTEKYGIILPYNDEELSDTIIKKIYKEEFIKEEISEKIRLFYVALTRCREKMIIVANLDEEVKKSNEKIEKNIRLKYRSFLDILNSLEVLEKYKIDKTAVYTKNYLNSKEKIKSKIGATEKIEKRENYIKEEIVENHKFSKQLEKILTKSEIELMEYGTKIHEELEYTKDNKILNLLLNNFNKDYLNIYREYEFIYEENQEEYHGIIDMLIEYEDKMIIIDYKLKNTDDKNYIKQLMGYKKYIETITNKKTETYLYSILNNTIKEI